MNNIEFLTFRQLTYRLYVNMMKTVLDRYGMTQMEMDILLYLYNNPGHNTASQIVSVRGLTKSQVSTAVDELSRKGLLARQTDRQNLRRIRLSLMPAASPIVEMGRKVQREFAAALLRGISQEEQAMLGSLMHRMIENTRDAAKQILPC